MKIITAVGVVVVAGLIGYTTTNVVLKNKIGDNNVAATTATAKKAPVKRSCTPFADSYNKKASELNAVIAQYKSSGCYNRGPVSATCKKIGDTATALRKDVDGLKKIYEECVLSNDEQPKYIKK